MHKASRGASVPDLVPGDLPQDLPSVTDSSKPNLRVAKDGSAPIQPSGVNSKISDIPATRSLIPSGPGDGKPVEKELTDEIGRRLLAVNSVAQLLSHEIQDA